MWFPRELPPTAGLPLILADLLQLGRHERFGECAAQFLGVPETQVECSGSAALWVALTLLRRRSARRTVIVPAYSCPLVPLVIRKVGLCVLPCDVRPDSLDLDLEKLNQALSDDTLAVIPTHYGGALTNVTEVTALVKARDSSIWVIEDAAQGFGARRQGQSVGMSGDIGFFSLARGKGLTLYEGGLLVARDPAVRSELRNLSAELIPWSPMHEATRAAELLGYALCYRPVLLPLVYGWERRRWLRRGDFVRAIGDYFDRIPLHQVGRWRRGVGEHALARLRGHLARCREQFGIVARALSEVPGVRVLEPRTGEEPLCTFLFLQFESVERARRALTLLWGSSLGVSKLFVHDLGGYEYLKGFVPHYPTPYAEAFAARTITISTSFWRSARELQELCGRLRSVQREARFTPLPTPAPVQH